MLSIKPRHNFGGFKVAKCKRPLERVAHKFLDFLNDGGCYILGCGGILVLGSLIVLGYLAFWTGVIVALWHYVIKFW